MADNRVESPGLFLAETPDAAPLSSGVAGPASEEIGS
jgi:hypothetical protein